MLGSAQVPRQGVRPGVGALCITARGNHARSGTLSDASGRRRARRVLSITRGTRRPALREACTERCGHAREAAVRLLWLLERAAIRIRFKIARPTHHHPGGPGQGRRGFESTVFTSVRATCEQSASVADRSGGRASEWPSEPSVLRSLTASSFATCRRTRQRWRCGCGNAVGLCGSRGFGRAAAPIAR